MDKVLVKEALAQLTALGFEYGDEVKLGLYAKPDKKLSPRKAKGTMPLLPLDIITEAEKDGRSIYFCVNRDYKNEDVKECRILFYEHDDISKEESLTSYKSIGLPPPTLQVDTGGKSIHTYYLLDGPIDPVLWRTLQQGFIHHLKSDPSLHNPGRVMRLAGSMHPDTGETATIINSSGESYPLEIFTSLLALPTVQPLHNPKDDVSAAINYLNHMGASVADEYHSWVKVGMALKAVSPSLLDEWIRWSNQSPKAVATDFAEKWDSFKSSGVGIGTLWYYAYNFGTWKGAKPKNVPASPDTIGSNTRISSFKKSVDGVLAFVGDGLRYNSLANTYVLNGVEMGINDVVAYVEYSYQDLTRFKERAIVDAAAKHNQFNPIIDYIKSCTLCSDISHTNVASKYWGGTAQEDKYVEMFLRAAVLRQLPQVEPVVFPFVLVLIGESGCGKTATFNTLFQQWIHYMSSFGDPHQGAGLSKNWLCLWDEMLPVLNPKNRDKVNEFISKNYLTQNIMYGEKHKQSPCSFVIGGTTTDYQFLSDSYSQRRWMVCNIPSRVDITQLKKNVDSIWASAYKSVCESKALGSFDELIKTTTANNKRYINDSDYEDIIMPAVNAYLESGQNYVYVPELISTIYDTKPPQGIGAEIRSVLKANGFTRKQCSKAPHRDKSVWVKPD
jgi:hypothetical protein